MRTLSTEEKEQLHQKLQDLMKAQAEKMNLTIVESIEDEESNVHVLAKRHVDDSYVVWSTYYTGEERTSYSGFYNGKYDLDIFCGVKELKRRLNIEES